MSVIVPSTAIRARATCAVRSRGLPEEGHEDQAEHVERRQQRRRARAAAWRTAFHAAEVRARVVVDGLEPVFAMIRVLRVEAREERHARDRQRADRMHANVMGIFLRSPPILRMSCSWWQPWITEPAERNRQALKKACVTMWNMPATTPPTPRSPRP